MNLLVKPKPKEKQEYKCYRCGYTSFKQKEFCLKCSKEDILINMIPKIE